MKWIEKFRKIVGYLLDPRTSRLLLAFRNNGYLVETGWLASNKKGEPLDKHGKPIPWATYSFIQYVEKLLNEDMAVFEFGSGNSTLFWADRVKSVVAVEHDKRWASRLRNREEQNVKLIHRPLDAAYEKSLQEEAGRFDIIFIDGRRRVACIRSAVKMVDNRTLIILDDSERPEYEVGRSILKSEGFGEIEFWGIAPLYFHNKCTSVFCRDFNAILNK